MKSLKELAAKVVVDNDKDLGEVNIPKDVEAFLLLTRSKEMIAGSREVSLAKEHMNAMKVVFQKRTESWKTRVETLREITEVLKNLPKESNERKDYVKVLKELGEKINKSKEKYTDLDSKLKEAWKEVTKKNMEKTFDFSMLTTLLGLLREQITTAGHALLGAMSV